MEADVRLESSLLAVESGKGVHALLSLTAPPAPDMDRPPLHIALVLDRSGSMAGDKIETTKECAKHLVTRLSPEDTLALVIFDNEVELLAASAPVDRERLLPLIASITVRGSTNLSGGWLKGREELLRPEGEGLRRLLLLTDGHANQGIVDPARLAELTGKTRGEGIGTSTIGFGAGFDEGLLTAMADAGGGRSYFAETPDEAPGIFAEEFDGLASVVAQNLSVEIRPAKEVEGLEVLNEFPTVEVPGGVQAQLGDAFGEEERRLLFRLDVPALDELGPVKLAELVVRYVTVGEDVEAREVRIPVNANVVSAGEAAHAGLDPKVTEEVVVLAAAKARRRARDLAEEGRPDEAARALEDAAGEIERTLPGSARAQELRSDMDELRFTAEKIRAHGFDLLDGKRLHYEAYDRTRSRDPRSDRRRSGGEGPDAE